MKTLPVRVLLYWVFSAVIMMAGIIHGASAAHAADAPSPPMALDLALPSSVATGIFSRWFVMHVTTFKPDVENVREQCKRAEPTESWLTPEHCRILVAELDAKQCRVVMVPDGIRLDRLLGRVDGGKGPSKAWAKQEKHTGRLDRALLCDLGGGVYSYWFTGEDTSCNNVAFVYMPPVAEPPLPTPKRKMVCGQVWQGSKTVQPNQVDLDGFVLRNDCCCGEDLVVPSYRNSDTSTSQSGGYVEECFFLN